MSKMFVTPGTPIKTRKVRSSGVQDVTSEEVINVIEINSDYKNVTVGCTMKLKRSSYRSKPYSLPERNRTKSENSDCNYNENFPNNELFVMSIQSQVDSINMCPEKHHIKKSKSLEDIRIENLSALQNSHELEFVSSRIKQLQVQDK